MTTADFQLLLGMAISGLIGLFTGRFLNICIERFAQPETLSEQLKAIGRPWTVCRHCPALPCPAERLPVVRWLTSGRCHACDRRLPRSFPVIEFITAILFALLFWRETSIGNLLASGGLTSTEGPRHPAVWADPVWTYARLIFHAFMLSGLIVATEIDRRFRIIPDGSTVPLMIAAMLASVAMGQLYTVPIWFQDESTVRTLRSLEFTPALIKPLLVYWDPSGFIQDWPHLHGLMVSVVGLLVGAGSVWTVRQIGFVTLKQEAMGFGDVVLMAMIGSFIGWQPVLAVFVAGAPVLAVFVAVGNWLLNGDNEIPYGPFLSGATVLLLLTWPATWPFAKRFFDMGPLLLLMCVAGITCLACMLYLVQLGKRWLGFAQDIPEDAATWSSADHLSYYNSERPDEQTGLWPTPQWPGSRAGRGLKANHHWKHDS